jgi:hypothetical protein
MKQLTYISGSMVILSGASKGVVLPTVPHKAKEIVIGAETGNIYFEINSASGSASGSSAGFVPANTVYTISNVYNVNTLHLFGTGNAHILYFTL